VRKVMQAAMAHKVPQALKAQLVVVVVQELKAQQAVEAHRVFKVNKAFKELQATVRKVLQAVTELALLEAVTILITA
tara:strand:- start:227 stop:457 length:231 start_codon:yes stop_codon:yes gene_type:complete